jgi:hypothetical protein
VKKAPKGLGDGITLSTLATLATTLGFEKKGNTLWVW